MLMFWLLTVSVVNGAFAVFSGVSIEDLPFDYCQDTPPGGYKPHISDCSRYVRCMSRNSLSIMKCQHGLLYDDRSKTCNFPATVQCRLTPQEAEKMFIVEKLTVRRRSPLTKRQPPQYGEKNGFWRDDKTDLLAAVKKFIPEGQWIARNRVRSRLRVEARLAGKLPVGQPSFSGVSAFLGSNTVAKRMTLSASQQLEVVSIVRNRFNLTNEGVTVIMDNVPSVLATNPMPVMPDMDLSEIYTDLDTCPFPDSWDGAPNTCNRRAAYRTIDGTCNNLRRPLQGRAMTPLARLLKADYCDNIDCPRRSKTNDTLPSARLVSRRLFTAKPDTSYVHTLMVMTVGQFIDHDLTRTAIAKLSKDVAGEGELSDVTCGSDGCSTEGVENRACLPIFIPPGDPQFTSRRCLMFVRTQEVPMMDCQLAGRQQLNQLTHYLDASNVYGSTKEEADRLRDTDQTRGRLRTTKNPNPVQKALLPQDDNPDCRDTTDTIRCFQAGDERVNENVALVSIHSIMMRVHNDIEGKLHTINPQWDGERLYQETRKIVGAIWQHIVYNEYLPIVLGPRAVDRFGLRLLKAGFSSAYDIGTNAGVSNVFATAAFRFGHSMVTDTLRFSSQDYSTFENLPFSSVLQRPFEVYNDQRPGGSGIDSILHGLVSQKVNLVDRQFTEEVTAHLFAENPPNGLGTDLASLNIQRGRDHGLPGYNAWRTLCGLPVGQSFQDLPDIDGADTRKILSELYDDVDDVDIFAGGVSERLVPGGLVGPTFACILGRQFRNLKVGDRFWYENRGRHTGFTLDQLTEIRRITLAKLLCQGTDRVDTIQKFVMLQPISEAFRNLGGRRYGEVYSLASLYHGEKNERRPCSRLPDIDLTKWKTSERVYRFGY